MKYYKSSKFAKSIGTTGIIAIAACSLIAVGAIAWFALSRKNPVSEKPLSESKTSQDEYNNSDVSYNSSADTPTVTPDEPVADANKNVSDIKYGDDEPTPQPQPAEEEKVTYIMPIEGNISKGYSDSALQYSATYGDMRLHTGVDILCDSGSDIKSVSSGTVKSVTDDAKYGKVITVEYADNITVKYCGMGSVNVKDGDSVTAGTVIGTSGEIPCECADNPHIHIEVTRDGNAVSPLEALNLE